MVVLTERGELLQPLVDVFDQTALAVVHVDPGRDMHGRNENHALAHSALLHGGLYLGRDVQIFAMFLGVEGEVFGVESHDSSWGNPKAKTSSV